MTGFVELSVFYFVRDGSQDGYVLWGEGVVRASARVTTPVRSEGLGDGLRVLRVACDFETAVKTLTGAIFPYTHGGLVNIHMGLVQRPAVAAIPPYANLGTTCAAVLHQFVRRQKTDAFGANGVTPGVASREELERLFARLETFVPFAFRGQDAARVGDVVLLEDHALAPAPVSFSSVLHGDASPEGVSFTVEPHARTSTLDINIRIRGTDDAVLDDLLVRWEPGTTPTFDVPTNQRFGGIEMRVWRDGRLLWRAEATRLLERALNVHIVSGTVVLNDRLTNQLERAIQAGNAPASALPQTRTVTQQSMASQVVVGANVREPWRQSFLAARREVFDIAPPPAPTAEYFPQGGGGRAAAIAAFVKLLQSGRSFLVDPFFDAFGAADLLPRITGDADLTIVTSLPDDADRSCERLVTYLNEARGFLPSGIKVRRVTRSGSSEQAFHDRYLIVMGGDAPPRAFLLSNSFSGLARKYPMVVAEMSVGTAGAVLDDIERLLGSKNVTALWPPPPSPPFIHDAFGSGWRWYLGRLVPRKGRSTRDWLVAASSEKWLHVDVDGNPQWSTQRQQDILARIFPRRERTSRLFRHRRRSTRRSAVTRRIPALGLRVDAIGERAARGLGIDASDVAARLGTAEAHEIASWLRTSFRTPDSWERDGHWRARTGVHQALRDPVVILQRVRQGLSLWSDTETMLSLRRDFGRDFVYRVLLLLDPMLAFRLGVELGDPSLLLAALDGYHLDAWNAAVTAAALSSPSAMMRALGAQSLASPDTRGDFTPFPEPPAAAAIPGLLRQLEGIDPNVGALACLEWAARVEDDGARLDLVISAMNWFPQLSGANSRDAASVLLGNTKLLTSLVDALPLVGARSTVRDAISEALANILATKVDENQWNRFAECAPALGAIILSKHDTNYQVARADVERLLGFEVARKQAEMVSPFRRHPEWQKAAALLAFGQLLFVHMRKLGGADLGTEPSVESPWTAEASAAVFRALQSVAEHP